MSSSSSGQQPAGLSWPMLLGAAGVGAALALGTQLVISARLKTNLVQTCGKVASATAPATESATSTAPTPTPAPAKELAAGSHDHPSPSEEGAQIQETLSQSKNEDAPDSKQGLNGHSARTISHSKTHNARKKTKSIKDGNLKARRVAADLAAATAAVQNGSAMTKTVDFSSSTYTFQPLGYLQTCFTTRNGTPRQPLLVPLARGVLVLDSKLPETCLDGLQQWSHVWVLYVFHRNTESSHKTSLTDWSSLKPRIQVPRLNGGKQGLLATRTPHRPSPIGLSVAQVISVKGRRLVLGGADIVTGSPILDIKPYVPYCDAVGEAKAPAYVKEEVEDEPLSIAGVRVTEEGARQLGKAWSEIQKRSLYASAGEFVAFVCQVLSLDFRSLRQRLHEGQAAQTRNAASYASAVDVRAKLHLLSVEEAKAAANSAAKAEQGVQSGKKSQEDKGTRVKAGLDRKAGQQAAAQSTAPDSIHLSLPEGSENQQSSASLSVQFATDDAESVAVPTDALQGEEGSFAAALVSGAERHVGDETNECLGLGSSTESKVQGMGSGCHGYEKEGEAGRGGGAGRAPKGGVGTGVFHVVLEGVDVFYDVSEEGEVLIGGASLTTDLARQHADKHARVQS